MYTVDGIDSVDEGSKRIKGVNGQKETSHANNDDYLRFIHIDWMEGRLTTVEKELNDLKGKYTTLL